MRATVAALIASAVLTSAPAAQTKSAKTFDIYLTDTEGGKATLFVSPSGESVLIDTGNPNPRDTDRILAMLAEAGVKQIDHLILTHYHVDHVGGLQELAKRVTIKHFVDHGPSVEEREQVQGFQAAYAELHAKAKHTVVKPGDKLPVAGLDWRIITSAGKAHHDSAPGWREAQSVVRQLQAAPHVKRPGKWPVGRQRHHVREVPDDRSRRSALGQGKRLHVPEQSRRARRSLHRVAPRHRPVRISGARAWSPAAGRDLQNGTRKGGTAADVSNAQLIAGLPGPSGRCIGPTTGAPSTIPLAFSSRILTSPSDRGRADRASWRRPWRPGRTRRRCATRFGSWRLSGGRSASSSARVHLPRLRPLHRPQEPRSLRLPVRVNQVCLLRPALRQRAARAVAAAGGVALACPTPVPHS